MADLEKSTFRAVGQTDERLYGHSAVLLAGASAAEQESIRALMDSTGLGDIRAITITRDTVENTLDDICRLPAGTGFGVEEHLPRAIVMSGLTEVQFHSLMDGYRASGLPRPIWASVTPISGTWTMKALLIELLEEREALRRAKEASENG